MNIQVSWDNAEQTTIRWDFDGRWAWDDFREAQIITDGLIASQSHLVHIIGNLEHSPGLPPNALSAYKNLRSLQKPLDNRGIVILIHASIFISSMVALFGRLNRDLAYHLNVMATIEEARAHIAELVAEERSGV